MKNLLIITALSGAIAVSLGALGAHLLKETISPNQLNSFKTANLYHILHTIMLVIITFNSDSSNKILRFTSSLFIGGIILFSGSIYLLSTKELLSIENWKWLGPVTPIGGLLFIGGWITLAFYGYRTKQNR